jgi:hypothetical protein
LRHNKKFTVAKTKGKRTNQKDFDFLQLFYQDKDFNGCWCIKTVSEIPKDNELTVVKSKLKKNRFYYPLISQLVTSNLKKMTEEETTL